MKKYKNKNSGVHTSPHRGCNENILEEELEEKENDCDAKIFLMKEGLYKAVSEDWLGQFR